MKLKRNNSEIQLHKTFKSDNIKFSWQYLTTNKKYTFGFFKKDMRNEVKAWQGLSAIVNDLCSSQWDKVLLRSKEEKHGVEILNHAQIKFSANGYTFSDDQNVIVFRFGAGNGYRLLGVKGTNSNVLYVIGYDFDYSAYNHGS